MAFSKAPSQSTYQTKVIKLMKEVDTRNSTPNLNDEDYVNVYFESVKNRLTGENEQYIIKRAGTTAYSTPGIYTNIRGMYFWEDQQRVYVALGRDLLYYDLVTNTLGATYTNFFAGSTGDVGFTEFLYDTNVVTLVILDGTTLNEITSAGGITPCVDADFPTPHEPTPIFLDGYIFVLKSGTADVYNSDLNNPQSWTAGNFLSAEMNPDTCTKIAKLNNYMVVFGSNSIEYFWDAANATGSPLRRNDTPFKNTGYLGGLASYGNKLYFIGNENESEPAVYMLDDFKIQKISTEAVSKYLSSLTVTYSTYKLCIISFSGHIFLVLNAGTLTPVMEMDTKLWSRWDWKDLGLGFNSLISVNTKTSTTYRTIVGFSGTGQLYTMLPTTYQDAGTNFTCIMVTPANEFETMNRKNWHRLTIWCDRPRSDSLMSVSWTDNDWITYSTPVTVNLNQDIPCIYRLGQARQRAFKFTYADNFAMRLKQVEVDINMMGT